MFLGVGTDETCFKFDSDVHVDQESDIIINYTEMPGQKEMKLRYAWRLFLLSVENRNVLPELLTGMHTS